MPAMFGRHEILCHGRQGTNRGGLLMGAVQNLKFLRAIYRLETRC
jgi:hypothetical protein